mmetsp:Transcript_82726/g.256782  ORF Transcript_82726/g.256782 Transcript_82726/m.256782 type:complete len:806 (+) Transcript_82726:3-2420(+)
MIHRMVEEQRRRDDYTRRLQKKLQKLSADLADRSEEAESLQRTLKLERSKADEENQSLKRERETKARNQENRIREYISDVLYQKPANTAKAFELETVRVTFAPTQSYLYPLTFRIEDSTTITTLKKNACFYWNVNPEDYILRTMANNKCADEMLVRECFKQGELAQLRLEPRKLEVSEPKEEELKAIMPKGKQRKGKNRDPRYNAEGIEKIQKYNDNYAMQLRKMGGIYFLLKLRDTKPSEHFAKIKLRDILIYTALAVLTFWVYSSRRPAGEDFWYLSGIEERFMREMPKPDATADAYASTVPGFADVTSHSELWDWLNVTLPAIIWSQDALGLGAYNHLVGFMSLRVQNVKNQGAPEQDCGNNKELVQQLGGSCYQMYVEEETQMTSDFTDLVSYWSTATQPNDEEPEVFRGSVEPWRWMSDEENREKFNTGSLTGTIDFYDASGYSVHYKMEVANKTKSVGQYREDLAKFKEVNWISLATRVVIISLTTYNFDYDMWMAADFMFEIPPSGAVQPRRTVRPFKPRIDEAREELTETYIDYVRMIIAVYILTCVGFNERRHKIKYHKAGAWYHVTLNGITDYGIVVCVWIVVIWRGTGFGRDSTGQELALSGEAFRSYSELAFAYESIFCVEGLMMVFIMYRMLSFFRLNHTIFLLWRALGGAWTSFGYFTLMFAPAILGFIFVLHSRFGPYVDEYSQLSTTSLQIYRIMAGNIDVTALIKLDTLWACAFVVIFYIVVTILLMNVFVTIVVDAYYVVQITAGGPGEPWSFDRLYRWATWGLLVNIIQAAIPSNTSWGKGGAESV